MVSSMTAEEKLRAVQLWNVLSEKLQEIVNNSAADINALAFQEQPSAAAVPDFFFYPPAAKQATQQPLDGVNSFPLAISDQQQQQTPSSNKSPTRDSNVETDNNSLASFSDIQCADDESIHMDGVCPLALPLNVEERSDPQTPTDSAATADVDKEKIKQFECLECGIAFRTKGHLLDHSRKHTGNRLI